MKTNRKGSSFSDRSSAKGNNKKKKNNNNNNNNNNNPEKQLMIERRIRAGRKRITNDDDEIYRSRTTSPGKKCRLSHDHPWYRNHSRFGDVRNRILKRNFTNTSPWGIRRVSCVGRIPPKRIMPVNWWRVVRCRRSVWMPQPNWQGKVTFSGKECFPGHRLPTDTSLYPPVVIPRYWWRCKRRLGIDFKDNLRTNWNRLHTMEYYVSWNDKRTDLDTTDKQFWYLSSLEFS